MVSLFQISWAFEHVEKLQNVQMIQHVEMAEHAEMVLLVGMV